LLRTTEWTIFLVMLGSGVLTFLAGAEIVHVHPWLPSESIRLSIGVL
jgi:hypothetical protein